MTIINDIWVQESPKGMAVGEAEAFTIDFAELGTPAASPITVTAYDAAGADKSSTVLTGTASVTGTIATLKLFTPASAQTYRLVCAVVISGNTKFGAIDVTVISIVPASGITNGYTTRQAMLDLLRVNVTDKIDDDVLDSLITAASRYIDGETRRTFYARTETRYFSVPDREQQSDTRKLWLDDDLLTITTLTNGDATVLTSADYNLLPRNETPKYAIQLKDSSDVIWEVNSSSSAEFVISIAGTWGYSSTTPADIALACKLIVESAYRNRFGENMSGAVRVTGAGIVITPQDVPALAAGLIERYVRIV